MKEKLIALRDQIIEKMHELELLIYNRTLYPEDQVKTWEEVDKEVIIRMTDIDQDCDEIAMLDPILDLPNHTWDCAEWYAYKDCLKEIEQILQS